MKHHRSPTLSYPQDAAPLSIHAALALRYAYPPIPTLLSPLRSIANTPPHAAADADDDFQSNACVNAASCRPPLAGLGITYLRDSFANLHGQPLAPEAPEDASLQMQVDSDELLLLPTDSRGSDTPPFDFPAEGRCIAHCTPNLDLALYEEPTSHLELGLDGDIDLSASNVVGLIPDVNMYDKLRRVDLSHPGVNPLDTIRSTSFDDLGTPYEEPPATLTRKDTLSDDLLPAVDSGAEQGPSPRVIQDIMSILIQPAPEPSSGPWSSTSLLFARGFSPSQPATPRSSVSTKLGESNVPDSEHLALPAPCNLEDPNAAHSSPILNAHLGIELNELISRAEQFRTKYPERDIDRAWLSHFSGKLSDRGELLNDFRCYVIGCDQRNKRRDHILVHVGAHIGQRPFACSVCSLRFLRKNECKRHEASHSGFRPYNCDMCGQSFVRQDLVKRHVKRTHGLRDENEPGVAKQSAKKRARLH